MWNRVHVFTQDASGKEGASLSVQAPSLLSSGLEEWAMSQVKEQSSPCLWTAGPDIEAQGLTSESKAKVKQTERSQADHPAG